MTPSEVVDAFIAAIERKDVTAAGELVADDVSYENMPMDPIVGRDAMVQVLEGFLAPANEVSWPCTRQVEVGNVVINERLDRFQIGDGWLELPIAGVFEVVDGKITLWRDYFDMNSYMNQLRSLTS
jgi:limonene-1,2-epoxide hydrolase